MIQQLFGLPRGFQQTCSILASLVGGGRVLKTLLCVHDQGGLVVVKVVALSCLRRYFVVGPSYQCY